MVRRRQQFIHYGRTARSISKQAGTDLPLNVQANHRGIDEAFLCGPIAAHGMPQKQ
jgi:hypothetical protein